ncbi:MAG: zinc-binding dehydrogenase [Micrococcaceae bacterium]|nr:zinc-binding dehydrogenase [Micrococcaceae bacterium]
MPTPIRDRRVRPVPAHMNAAFIDAPGGPGAIRYGVLPVPVPGPGQLVLRTEALAVNHVDVLVRSGAYATELDFPFVVGRDVVGIVVRRGEGTEGFSSGERLWCNSLGHAGRQGSFSEYVLTEADRSYRLPPGVEAADAVAVLHGAATAHLGLMNKARMAAGELVIILGAAGAVGSAAVQLAAEAGCRVIAVAGARDADWVAALGAGAVLDYRDPDMVVKLARAAAQDASVVWDCSGSMAIDDQARLLGLGGRIIHTAGLDAHQEIDTGALYRRDISVHGFAISNASVPDLAVAAAHLNALFAGPGICTRIGATLPLSATAEAHRMLEAGKRHRIGGKIVVVPDPP